MTEAIDASAVEMLVEDDGNLFALYKNVMLQIRVGALSLETLELAQSAGRLMRARKRGQPGALISVLEESASVTSAEVRRKQMEAIQSYLANDNCWMVAIITATGVKGSLLRAAVRLVALGQPKLGVYGSTNSAVVWLASQMRAEPTAPEMAALIGWGRDRMRQSPDERTPIGVGRSSLRPR